MRSMLCCRARTAASMNPAHRSARSWRSFARRAALSFSGSTSAPSVTPASEAMAAMTATPTVVSTSAAAG
ncbi:hypothetical protein [Amycolatopsis sp. NPDC051716]|uniref:hypothetical protein n=1 Tax=Amycolatopsis sp. NPDC051716 TaxID=3155804 RepID=UPI00341E2085